MSRIYMPKKCNFPGVYVLMNLNNGKCYVGSSNKISYRLSQHKSLLNVGKEPAKEMQCDFDNGHDFLFYPVLEFHPIYEEKYRNKNDLVALENQTMDFLDSIKNGYNKKQDLMTETAYQRDIKYSKIYLLEMKEYIDGNIDYLPYMRLTSSEGKLEY